MTDIQMANVGGRLDTNAVYIPDLISGVKRGEIKIPQFQRQFVWKDEQALNLLDSISNNYPVGSLLLWKTPDKLKAERNIGEFKLPATDDLTPTDYVLDGQQRLTVIYSCMGALDSDGGFIAAYDLENEQFIRLSGDSKQHYFPLRWVFDTTKLLNFRTGLQTHVNSATYQERLDLLLRSLTSYKIPVVTLKDLTVEEVCPIFERINSSGTKLSTFDLMVAATWTRTFDLNDQVDEICDALLPKGFADIDRNTVLKCLSAIELGTIKETALKTLRDSTKVNMDGLVKKTKKSLLKTVDLLSTEFGIHSWAFLSYEALVIIVSYIYSKQNNLDASQVKRLKRWFWRSSFSERYKVGGENFVSNDMNNVFNYVVNNVGKKIDFGPLPTSIDWKSIMFRSNTSRSRAFILALASKKPRNLTNGANIDTAEALSIFNRKQYHHVFPQAHIKRTCPSEESNLLANICILSAAANNFISDKDPNSYIPDLVKELDKEADAIFSSNLLPIPSTMDYSKITYNDFLTERIKLIVQLVDNLCD